MAISKTGLYCLFKKHLGPENLEMKNIRSVEKRDVFFVFNFPHIGMIEEVM